MNYQTFLSEVGNLKSLMSAPNTFKTRRSIRKVKKNINKIIKSIDQMSCLIHQLFNYFSSFVSKIKVGNSKF